jgi:acyl-CoA synthetase (AMP-forming)/AMP-acid ligase II
LRELAVADLMDQAADRWPDREAVVYPELRWTFSQYREQALTGARALLAAGLEPGDRLAVWATNRPEWLQLQFAAAYTGVVLVPANPAYQRDEIAFILSRSGARACVHEPEHRGTDLTAILESLGFAHRIALGPHYDAWVEAGERVPLERVHRARRAVTPEHTSQIQYTSGTTGFPKGAELHNFGLANNARLFAHRAELREGGRHCNPMPFFHCGGSVMSTLGALATGSALLPVRTFDAPSMLDTIQRERATSASAVPTMLIALEEEYDRTPRDLGSLDVIVTGGSPMPVDLQQRWIDRFGVRFTITFGATEASPVVTQSSPSDPIDLQIATCGVPLDHIEVQVVDPVTRVPVPLGTPGEFRHRSRMVMKGYWDDPSSTARALEDGWLHSGDLATLDEDGYIRVVGRVKDMIIRGGENLDPAEIETALRTLEPVIEAAVVGAPDDRYGEQVVAFVRLAPGAHLDEAAMRRGLDGRLSRYKFPHRLITVDALPLTPSGKVEKFRLREWADVRQ